MSAVKVDGTQLAGATRRMLLGSLATALAGASAGTPALAQTDKASKPAQPDVEEDMEFPSPIELPVYSDELMNLVNLHEFEAAAQNKISQPIYDYIRAGAADDLTLKANLEAFSDYWIRRRVMVDVSKIDTSVELFGRRYEHPILLGPCAVREMARPDGDRATILAAHKTQAILVGAPPDIIAELAKQGSAPVWWAATLGHASQEAAQSWARLREQQGASALCVSLDYPYSGARDAPSRDRWESQWFDTPRVNTGEGSVTFQAGMIWPYAPGMKWEWLKWVRAATKLPIVAKGITTAEDARTARRYGADAIAVSNHGGRTLDGAQATLHALPAVVDAVGGAMPVLMDGGVRRGGDVIKALALGARAVMIGRPYLWGLAAFGQDGVQRVVELLQGELRVALGLSGTGRLAMLDRSLIRRAWQPYSPAPHGVSRRVPR